MKHYRVLALVLSIFLAAPLLAQPRLDAASVQPDEASIVAVNSCRTTVAMLEVDGLRVPAMEGDMVCILGADGSDVCSVALQNSTPHTCPNGKKAECATECGTCATGTGTKADCEACCGHFHTGASRLSCIRNYC